MVALLGVFESELQLVELVLEVLGVSAMAVAAGGEVTDADLEGLALGFSLGGLELPGIATAEQLGDEDAGWCSELGDRDR